MYVIGIDGGGTKTTGVIVSHKGEIIKEVTVGGTNLNSKARSDVIFELINLINKLRTGEEDRFYHVTSVFAGMSGAGNEENQQDLKNIITSLLPQNIKVTIDHDAITALYSGTLGEPGLVQIAGTGAIAYGVNQEDKRARVGGWGHYFSDLGSGYSIGRDGLQAAFMAHDKMARSTLITELLLDYFKATELPELVHHIYQHANPKEKIASLSRIVMEAADKGDEVAVEVIQQNATHLGEALSTLAFELFPSDTDELSIVLAGGLFNRFDLLKKPIKEALLRHQIKAKLIIPAMLPIGGAVIAALKTEGINVTEEMLVDFKHIGKEGE